MRLLHVADIHLDTAFAGRPEHRAQLRQWQREAFVAAVDLALEREVAAMLDISRSYVSRLEKKAVRRITQEFNKGRPR